MRTRRCSRAVCPWRSWRRGFDTLRYGPLKPVGLKDPKTGKGTVCRGAAPEGQREGSVYNLVGFQTHLKFPEQKRVFSMIPALHNAEFVRYGVMHRNTFLDSPRLLDRYYADRRDPLVAFAGQMTGVEGYVESTASGYLAGVSMAAKVLGGPLPDFPARDGHRCAGGLHLRQSIVNFQPMNVNFGIMPALGYRVKGKANKNLAIANRSLAIIDAMTGKTKEAIMRILVDAMGGDNAPESAAALGAIRAAEEYGTEVVLVGRGEAILQCLKENGIETLPKGVEIANARGCGGYARRSGGGRPQAKDSSMVVGLRMLAEGGGDAFISAGSTGALLTAATLVVKRIKGIRRAAMGPVIPTKTGGGAVLIDCGANAECTPEFLLQFAFMGTVLRAENAEARASARVGLLNIGTEDSKGGALQKEAYALLKKAGDAGYLNFIGNVEAREVPLGGADVVVADGFAGNVLLKGIEGTALFMSSMVKDMFKKNFLTKLAALLCMSGVKSMKAKLDYRETGGTLLLRYFKAGRQGAWLVG